MRAPLSNVPEQMTKDSAKTPTDSNGASRMKLRSAASHGSLTNWMIRNILRGLYEGRYEPGQRITEAEMTATYGQAGVRCVKRSIDWRQWELSISHRSEAQKYAFSPLMKLSTP